MHYKSYIETPYVENRSCINKFLNKQEISVGKHLKDTIRYSDMKDTVKNEELNKSEVCAKFAHTTDHGAIQGKKQTRELDYYNLDMIISVGYRVNSKQGILFRKWANKVLKDYLIKGYAINQKRLECLEKTIKLIDIAGRIDHELKDSEAQGIIKKT